MSGGGIRPSTPDELFFDQGSITFEGTEIGATVGPTTFRVTKEDYIPELCGAKGEIRGTKYRVKEEAFLQVTMTAWLLTNLSWAVFGIDISSDASSEVMGSVVGASSSEVGCIADEYYGTVRFKGTDCNGYDTTIYLMNAEVEGDLEIAFTGVSEVQYTVTFKATYAAAHPTIRPWQIIRETA